MSVSRQWLCGLVVVILFAGCQAKTVRTGVLPSSSQIVSIKANLEGDFLGESSTEQFQVDGAFFEKVSKCLSTSPIETIDSSGFGKTIGVLEILDRAGKAYRVEFPWSGKNVLVFTVNGKWFSRNGTSQAIDPSSGEPLAFVADESMLLYKALRKHYEETKANGVQDRK